MDEETAYHEAGHCVLAVLSGARVHLATIAPEEDNYYGQVEIRWPRRRDLERELKTILAGPVAEMIYRGEPLHPGLVPEWAQDWQRAWELSERVHRDERQRLRYLERLTAQLHHFLNRDDCWAAIAAVSDLLLAHEEIEHDQIEDEVFVWIGR